MKVLMLGHGAHGKGTVCKLIRDITDMQSLSSSAAAFPYIWKAFDEATGYIYENQAQAYLKRGKHRMLLKELILLLNTPHKGTLCDIILRQVPIYDGMRSQEEFEVSEENFDLIAWVDASDRVKYDESMEIEYNPKTMVLINNNGSEEDLELEVAEFCKKHLS